MHERPILLSDFITLDRAISAGYRLMSLVPTSMQTILEPALNTACDKACNIINALGLENPNDVILEGYS